MSLAQIGEFSFIIATLALETHAARDFLYSLAVAVSVVTTFTTPYLIKASGPIASSFEQRFPRGLVVLEALYEAAVEHIRRRAASRTQVVTIRWSLAAVISSAIVIAGFIIGAEVFLDPLTFWVQQSFSLAFQTAQALIGVATSWRACFLHWFSIAPPALRGCACRTRRSRGRYGGSDRPPGWESLVEIMQVAMLIVVTIVVLAIVQPFLEPFEGVAVMVLAIVAMCIVTWRGVSRTMGQMREAARLIGRALRSSIRKRCLASCKRK